MGGNGPIGGEANPVALDMPRVRRAAAAPAIALPLRPERADLPLYVQLYQQLREHIVSGLLGEGRSLPSARGAESVRRGTDRPVALDKLSNSRFSRRDRRLNSPLRWATPGILTGFLTARCISL